MDKPFVFEQIYNSPIEKVWDALTDENKMKVWYFPQLKKFRPTVGFKFEFIDDGSAFQKEWQVTKLTDGETLAHSWVYKGHAGNSEVTFELFKEGAGTRLKLTHTGLASFPPEPHFARARFETGWQNILGNNLKNYLEKSNENQL